MQANPKGEKKKKSVSASVLVMTWDNASRTTRRQQSSEVFLK